MKKIRFVVLLLCLTLAFSFIHTAAAAYEQTESSEEQAESSEEQTEATETQSESTEEQTEALSAQYAQELSDYTGLAYYWGENAARYINFKIMFPDCSWETIITDVNIGLDNPYYTDATEIENPDSVDVLVNKYHYLASNFVPDELEQISSAYCFKTEMLTHDARVAFEKMCADARSLGYTLYATSSYRSYSRQVYLYNNYGIPDITTARPGHSEHQTGLAVDVIHSAVASNSALSQSDVYKWYAENACNYGFIIRYEDRWGFLTGYDGEPWHLRYLGAELATAVKNSGLSYDEYYTRYIGIPEKLDGEGEDDIIGITSEAFVTVEGRSYSLSAFQALDDTYFKLRDVAILLIDTPFEFDVTWDAEAKMISLLVGTPYSSDPSLTIFEQGQIMHMTAAMPPLMAANELYTLDAFMVNGSNYYTLESLGGLLGFTVTKDEAGIMSIETAASPNETAEDLSSAA